MYQVLKKKMQKLQKLIKIKIKIITKIISFKIYNDDDDDDSGCGSE